MEMKSRSGKNTVTSHFEFFKASQKEKESKLEPEFQIKPKIQNGTSGVGLDA